MLIGVKYTYEEVLNVINNIDVSKYFLGMSKEDIARAICNID